jgi:hypothetical protein
MNCSAVDNVHRREKGKGILVGVGTGPEDSRSQ